MIFATNEVLTLIAAELYFIIHLKRNSDIAWKFKTLLICLFANVWQLPWMKRNVNTEENTAPVGQNLEETKKC